MGGPSMPVSRLGARNSFLGAVGHWFLTGIQSHRPASPPSENWQEPLLPLTSLPNVSQQNSAADLSMLVLESLEKAISALLTMPKPLIVWITINWGKFFKRWEYQTTPPSS